jgi:hypothetical protein
MVKKKKILRKVNEKNEKSMTYDEENNFKKQKY